MRQIVLIALAIALTLTSVARVPQQQKERLATGWEFVRMDLGGIWEAVRVARTAQPEEQPMWSPVTLPHCFNATDAVDPDVNYYEGPGWYRTQIKIANPYKAGRTILEFEGAGQKSEVYIFNKKVGSHVGGYDSWTVDITDAVREFLASKDAARFNGKVPLTIRCDNSRDLEMIPSDLSDFNLYGGLYRHLNLIYLPAVSLEAVAITPTLDKSMRSATVKVTASFYNPQDVRKADLTIKLSDPTGKVVMESELKNITPLGNILAADVTLQKPIIWDVETPELYTCTIEVKAEGEVYKDVERFGIRNFEFVEHGPFMLNGRRVLLQGTHRHEDHAGVGAALTDSMTRREMQQMKDMGVNFIRLGHYQQPQLVLDLCDSLGIVVWEEIQWCRGGVGGEGYRNMAKQALKNLITQHRNHPCVIVWGLGNENDWPNDFYEFNQADIRRLMSELNTIAHTMDPTRKTSIRRCDFCKDIVDVFSPSIWAGWYSGDMKSYRTRTEAAIDNVPHYLHVEWGGDSHAGRHNEKFVDFNKTMAESRKKYPKHEGSSILPLIADWSESYIAKIFEWHIKEQLTMPRLTGTAFWTFKDFSTPLRPENPVPYVNQKGVVSRDGTPKESYYIFQSYWTTKPMIHIYGHSWPVRWGEKDEAKEILVYSNLPEVELFVNGVSCGVKRRNAEDFPAAGLRWNVPLKEGNNTIKAVAADKSALTDEITVEYQTQKWGKESALTLTATDEGNGKIKIESWLVDDKGVRCLDSQKFFNFEAIGDATLIQNMGTSTASRKVGAMNGRGVIYLNKGKGSAAVAVKSDGLPTKILNIE